ncbi:GntR family transcriptional regulator [Rhizobium sp. LjRoot30]|uniref:GntR family transcriptional regulator n=1 Tax=Rhizobium sp. LjRoot30 TaxID=3342320 RepID=UPI003ED0F5D6
MLNNNGKKKMPVLSKDAPQYNFKVTKTAAPLRHSVTESIRNSIAAGIYKAGDRLTERDLCEMTGVSRTAVREALRQLESEGMIYVLPHRGPIVAGVTPEQAEGIYQVRMELEGLASELFAQRATPADHKALRKAFKKMKDSSTSTDSIVRLKAKNEFYDCLISGAYNEALGQTLSMLNSRIMVLRATSLQAPGRTVQSMEELSELVELLVARKDAEARKAAIKHVSNAAKVAIGILRAQFEEAAAE